MKDKQIRILVVPSDRTGVSYYRSTKPHVHLEKLYPDSFRVDIDYEPKIHDDEWLKQYDIIHYHRTLGPYDKMEELLEKLNGLGIITVMDIDDYWSPGIHHPAYHIIKNEGLDKKIKNNIKLAKNVITTTPIFANEISKVNKSVTVLPNAIDPTEKQFSVNPTKSDRIRIGWLGGSSHLSDLELLKGVVSKLNSEKLLDKVQFVICGFDIRGNKSSFNKETGEKTTRPITPEESVWSRYEEIFTNNYTTISPEYKEHLLKFKESEFNGFENEPYRRVWTKPINSYASNYNLFDISLAPLAENTFNKVKSQLKVIESGFFSKPIIAQNFGPYQIDLENAYQKGGTIDVTKNALLVDSHRNHKSWVQYIKKLVQNPELIEVLGTNLNKMVTERYSINAVSEKRKIYYEKLVQEQKK